MGWGSFNPFSAVSDAIKGSVGLAEKAVTGSFKAGFGVAKDVTNFQFDLVKGGTDAVMGYFTPPDIPKGMQGPDPWEAYQDQRRALADSRTKDYGKTRARMASSGMAPDSPGWNNSLEAILASYDTKLEELGADPYFASVRDKAGFSGWGEAPAGAPAWYNS